MTVEQLVRGQGYNWIGQPERLVYLGVKRYCGDTRTWYQFAKTDTPHTVWCEVLQSDLDSIEETVITLDDATALKTKLHNEVKSYSPGSWFEAKSVEQLTDFYLSRLPLLRDTARQHGYALGLHGSLRRDLDVLAVPWSDTFSTPDVLAHALAVSACGLTREGDYQWTEKPAGRIATSIPICWTTFRTGVPNDGHLDLSVLVPCTS